MVDQSIFGSIDPGLRTMLIGVYVKDVEAEVQKMRDGLENKDFEQVRFYAHKMKGSSRMLGAMEFSDLAKIVENKIHGGDTNVHDTVIEIQHYFPRLKEYLLTQQDTSN